MPKKKEKYNAKVTFLSLIFNKQVKTYLYIHIRSKNSPNLEEVSTKARGLVKINDQFDKPRLLMTQSFPLRSF